MASTTASQLACAVADDAAPEDGEHSSTLTPLFRKSSLVTSIGVAICVATSALLSKIASTDVSVALAAHASNSV
jgi:hypothetical protein